MLTATNSITLRITTGLHAGAELQLPLGSHVIGTEDSCDIILVDTAMAGRHAVIHIVQQDEDITVAIEALDGVLVYNTERIEQGHSLQLAPCRLCLLGTTNIAWNTVGTAWEHLAPEEHISEKTSDSSESLLADANATSHQKNSYTTVNDAHNVGTLETLSESTPSNTSIFSFSRNSIVAICLALLCLSGVLIAFEEQHPDMTARAHNFEKNLISMGFNNITVEPWGQGLMVRGTLANEQQRTQLWRVAQNMLCPIHIEASVTTDIVNAVTSAFHSRGIYPTVTVNTHKKPVDITPKKTLSTHEALQESGQTEMAHAATQKALAPKQAPPSKALQPEQQLHIAAYMKDALVEAWAFNAMRKDVPQLPNVQRTIRYEQDVADVLNPALTKAELDYVRVHYLPGTVQITGNFDEAQRKALKHVLIETQKQLGVPIPFKLYADLPDALRTPQITTAMPTTTSSKTYSSVGANNASVTAPAQKNTQTHASVLDDFLGGTTVTSVTLSPLAFITTEDGQRFFIGGMLPSGYIIESITTETLTLRKNGRVATYKLRGSHE